MTAQTTASRPPVVDRLTMEQRIRGSNDCFQSLMSRLLARIDQDERCWFAFYDSKPRRWLAFSCMETDSTARWKPG